MTKPLQLDTLVGRWAGSNKLWLFPGDPVRESDTTATVELAAGGACATIRTTWATDGTAHEGILIIRTAAETSDVDAVFVDSFHTSSAFMMFRGMASEDGGLSFLGSYAAPPGPDWGWRITLSAEADGGFAIRMFNRPPEGQGEETPAVESLYARVGEGA